MFAQPIQLTSQNSQFKTFDDLHKYFKGQVWKPKTEIQPNFIILKLKKKSPPQEQTPPQQEKTTRNKSKNKSKKTPSPVTEQEVIPLGVCQEIEINSTETVQSKKHTPSHFHDKEEETPYIKRRAYRLCKNPNACRFGNRCDYAHSIEELVITPCSYGSGCTSVYTKNGLYYNNPHRKVCRFLHQEESNHNYASRNRLV